MNLEDGVLAFFAKHQLGPAHVLVAVSGGPDSTALLVAFTTLRDEGFQVSAAHVNHQLRGAESEADERFVRELCAAHGVELAIRQAPLDPDAIKSRGIEGAARELRYEALHRMREELRARWIATAHTRDDQAETVLLRLITGSGIAKLRAIRPIANHVLRPMLDTTRDQVESWLASKRIAARTDASNRDPRFLRNRIRAELLPLLESMNSNIVSTLARTAEQAREAAEAIEPLLQEHEGSWVLESDDDAVFDLSAAPGHPWLVRTALLRQVRRLDPSEREISAADLERIGNSLPELTRITVSPRLEMERRGVLATLRRAQQKPRR
jgi:tRNA(Ile)-lysidine synthase